MVCIKCRHDACVASGLKAHILFVVSGHNGLNCGFSLQCSLTNLQHSGLKSWHLPFQGPMVLSLCV